MERLKKKREKDYRQTFKRSKGKTQESYIRKKSYEEIQIAQGTIDGPLALKIKKKRRIRR